MLENHNHSWINGMIERNARGLLDGQLHTLHAQSSFTSGLIAATRGNWLADLHNKMAADAASSILKSLTVRPSSIMPPLPVVPPLHTAPLHSAPLHSALIEAAYQPVSWVLLLSNHIREETE